jgi:hypothetical protein
MASNSIQVHRINNFPGEKLCPGHFCFAQWGCGLLQNRDKTGATNISRQFALLIEGKDPLRVMTEEEVEFNSLNLCVECHE